MAGPREKAEQAFALLQDALRDSEARAAELKEALERQCTPRNDVEAQLEVLRQRLQGVEAECERWKRDAGALEEVVAAERAKVEQLRRKLELVESGPEKLTRKEINFWRSKAEAFDESSREYKSRLAQLRQELKARDDQIETLKKRIEQDEAATCEAAACGGTLTAENERVEACSRDAEELRAENALLRDRLKERETRVMELAAELEQLRSRHGQLEANAAELAMRIDTSHAESAALTEERDALRLDLEGRARESEQATARLAALELEKNEAQERVAELEQELAAAREQIPGLEQELAAAREHIAGLEQELLEEKRCTDNLSEVANERRERLTRLEDRLAEAEERYEEAKWRLGKAQHFERLVRRRKRLITSLIERIRTKSKANTALKAGLDGLRRYKAAAEAREHELLGRMDKLTARINEQEEALARHQAEAGAERQLEEARARIAALEQRNADQVDLVQSLEEGLKASKAMCAAQSGASAEVERLHRELAAKDELIARLESDMDEQQRKLSKLRGSASETARLKSSMDEEKAKVQMLEREVETLRAVLAEQAPDSVDARAAATASRSTG